MIAHIVPTAMGFTLETTTHVAHSASFMDTLPDPMKLDLFQVGFVILLVTLLYLLLKTSFFRPLSAVMDARENEIQAGASAKSDANAEVVRRQKDYEDKLRELRTRAFEHRKVLAGDAAREKAALLDKARADAGENTRTALLTLRDQQATAKTELLAQIDALSESMARQLLGQA